MPADIAIADHFGTNARIRGQRMVISSHTDDDLGGGSGSVYAYEFDGALWQQTQKLLASDGEAADQFGWSVSLADDVLAVGALDEASQAPGGGAIYMFRHDGTQWVEEQKLGVSTPGVFDEFGFDVATDGAVVVGTSVNNGAQASEAGTAYVFRFNGSSWVEEQKLLASDGATGDWLGWSAAVDGNRILLGAIRHDAFGMNAGAVYEWNHNGTSWVQTAQFAPAGLGASANFGWSMALDQARLAVGALGAASHGAVYVYQHSGSDWVQSCRLLASNAPGTGTFNDGLGQSIGLDGTHLIAGALFADGSAAADAGSAYAYDLDRNGLPVCAAPGSGSVPDGGAVAGAPLLLRKLAGGQLRLSWSASCFGGDDDYEVYEGTIGDPTSHVQRLCTTGGITFATLTPAVGGRYYLVVPTNGIREGSYGLDSESAERAPALVPCLEQLIAPCQ